MNLTIDRSLIATVGKTVGATIDFVAVVIPADATLDGSSLLGAMPGEDRSLWWQPEAGALVVASGTTVQLEAEADPDVAEQRRFASVALEGLADRIGVVDPYETGIGPRLVGGFSFFADAAWPAFGSGDLRLPEVAYVRDGSSAGWVVTSPRDEDVDAVAVVEAIASRLAAVDIDDTDDHPVDLHEPGREESRELIEATIGAIREGRFEKVVLARTASSTVDVDVARLAGLLAGRYPECATFAFERSGEWFVGATPELLVSKQGTSVVSAALAATAPRQSDPVLDRIELESLTTTKQLEEHRLVVEAVVSALEGLGVATSIHEQRVLELRRVRHLATAIEGTAPAGVDILDLVGALHPTPAVGGVPGSGALEWIRSNEGFVRGWYAAPVGFVDLSGDGEFRVALRSARITNGTVHFYAGAGIVAGSDPNAEMDEIDLKLGVMAAAVAAAR
jgi:isochorismate synthase